MKSKIIKISLFLLGILLITGGIKYFSLSDLSSQNANYPNSQAKAKNLLYEMGKAHGIHLWDSIQTYNVIYGDEFYGFLGTQSHPFKEQKLSFSLSYIPKTFNGQLEILTGKEKGMIWGIESGQTYQRNKEGGVSPNKNKDMEFWIPTYQYFIEFPNRIQEANAVEYVGSKAISGKQCEGVIASWGTIDPQKNIDQYVIWIDADTKRIVKVVYTIRDMYRFISGAAFFKNYKNYGGLLLPSELPVESNLLKKGFLHKMSIREFNTNLVDKEFLLPLS